MPAGLLVTVPLPVPARATVTVALAGVKATVIDFAAFIVIVHVPVPEQPAPFQPLE